MLLNVNFQSMTPVLPAEQTYVVLPSGVLLQAKPPTPRATLGDTPIKNHDNRDELNQATDNFLSMFG